MSVKVDNTRQLVVDTETTGLSFKEGDRIIEIGCVEIINRRLTGRHFHYYLNPQRKINIGALKVHGISNEFLKDKPLFSDIADELYEFIKGAELIAHNALFDIGFLDNEFKLTRKDFDKIHDYCQVFDTLTLARQMHPGVHNNLDALCKRYNVNYFNRELHGALLDSEILAQVYLAMTSGQMALTGLNEEVMTVSPSSTVATDDQSIRVIYANDEELAAYAEFLQLLSSEKSETTS